MTADTLSAEQIRSLESLSSILQPYTWILIGASAIQCHVPMHRPTADVDFAVATSGEAVFERMARGGWLRDPRISHRWRQDRAVVDAVPVTQEDLLAGIVHLEDGFELCLVGLDLAFLECDRLAITPSTTVLVPRLPALVLLKMIAWMDRPYDRAKDLDDIVHILDNALDADDERRWSPDSPVAAANLAYGDQSAFFVGWQLGRIAGPGHLHWARRFLDRFRNDTETAFAQLVRASRYRGDDGETRLRAILSAFEHGLERGTIRVDAGAPALAAARGAREPSPRRTGRRQTIAAGFPRRLTWGQSGSLEQRLHDAIDARRVIQFYYKNLLRIAQPHVLGTKNDRLQVLTFQIGGASSSGRLPDWRRFFVDELSQLELTSESFVPQPLGLGRHSAFDRQIAVVRKS